MFHKYHNSNFNYLIGLVILAGLLFSLAPPMSEHRASANTAQTPTSVSENSSDGRQQNGFGKTPLLFEANQGQSSGEVKFISRVGGYTLYLGEREATFSLKVPNTRQSDGLKALKSANKIGTDNLTLHFAGANEQSGIEGLDAAVTKSNYYSGRKRFENLPNFRSVKYTNLYEGVDGVFYGNEDNQLEYDFAVAPFADTDQIQLKFEGAEKVSIDQARNLVIKTKNSELIQRKPFAYQDVGGTRSEVECQYRLIDKQVSFSVGKYDRSRPLIIDPVLNYLTYLGGINSDKVDSMKVDRDGSVFLSGTTTSIDFPAANSRNSDNGTAIYVSKLSPDGQNLLYNTFLDGRNEEGTNGFLIGILGSDIAIDQNGNAYVTGVTSSRDFPVTENAHRRIRLCAKLLGAVCLFPEEAFVTKLDSQGNIVYSTYLGGRHTDFGNAIAVDSTGRAYVAGATFSGVTFPTKNAFQSVLVRETKTAFLTVLNADGSDIVYSTGLGGVRDSTANGIALDAANNVYITGDARGGNFPVKNAAQVKHGGGTDAFVAKFDTSLRGNASLIYSTFLGGSGTDEALAIAVSPEGAATVAGVTGSANFPLENAFDSTNQINEAFVTQYDRAGKLLNSTFLGGSNRERANAIALGNGGTIYVSGTTSSPDFPTALPFQAALLGGADAFFAKIRFGVDSNPGVASASYIGGGNGDLGNAIDVNGNFIFVAGESQSNDLSTTNGVIKQASNASGAAPDGFVAKILDTHQDTVGTFTPVSNSFRLKNTLTGGTPDISLDRGDPGDIAVSGDFNGDGRDTVSTFREGVWKIVGFNVITAGIPTGPLTANFGLPGDLPVVGDWDGDGIDTIGAFRPSTGEFFLSNSNSAPDINIQVNFGINGDLPVAGDWDGDGIDSVGVFRPSAGTFFLTNDNIVGATIDIAAAFGIAQDLPVAGDWDGNGVDTIGVWRPSTREFFLTNNFVDISNQFTFGANRDRPLAGDWDGMPN